VGEGSFFSVEAAVGGAECPQPGETVAKANRKATKKELLYRMITRKSSFDFVGFCDRAVVFCDTARNPLIPLQFIVFIDISIVEYFYMIRCW
jgi:hypothetical protein